MEKRGRRLFLEHKARAGRGGEQLFYADEATQTHSLALISGIAWPQINKGRMSGGLCIRKCDLRSFSCLRAFGDNKFFNAFLEYISMCLKKLS